MTKKTERLIVAALAAARKEIAGNAANGGRFAAGLANEGWAGGYMAALNDVLLVLNGVCPGGRYETAWEEAFTADRKRKNGKPARL